jgi:hypothetical protein
MKEGLLFGRVALYRRDIAGGDHKPPAFVITHAAYPVEAGQYQAAMPARITAHAVAFEAVVNLAFSRILFENVFKRDWCCHNLNKSL